MSVMNEPGHQNGFVFFLNEIRHVFTHLFTFKRTDAGLTKKVSMQQWLNNK